MHFKLIIPLLILSVQHSIAQQVDKYFQKGIEAIEAEKYVEAISFFDKAIEEQSDLEIIWYNRALVKTWIKEYENAIADLDQAILLNPEYKKAYNTRACTKQDITDYDGAMDDFNKAIEIDPEYIHAIYNRGELYNLLGERKNACADYSLALKLGDTMSERKVEQCSEEPGENVHSILYLKRKSIDKTYGFSSENPIMVGPGPNGGPTNQRAYLNLLRDVNGKPIEYVRLYSCCSYKSDYALIGDMALLDAYKITYTNEKGKTKEVTVYISMYDYVEPEIIMGFETIVSN